MSLLYIGAGLDFSILNLPMQMFFFVDSQPRSEYGSIDAPGFFRPNFIKELKQKLKGLGYIKFKRFAIGKTNPKKYYDEGVIVFISKDRSKVLYYFYSTTFPLREGHPLSQFIPICNTLFVKGHGPEANVVESMHCPITFIGSDDTVYSKSDKFFETPEKIKTWYIQEKATGEIKEIQPFEKLVFTTAE